MKIITVIGARPQFIKASAVSRAFLSYNARNEKTIDEVIVHTGQHYDAKMSSIFFDQLEIPKPKYNLGIAAETHGAMTGRMLEEVEKVLLKEKPDLVLVYGDTNSTLAGSVTAVKLHIPVAHVEAGLRSFNMKMPEEVNRILTDRVSNLLFCPTEVAVGNLEREGVTEGVYCVGDVMFDVTLHYRQKALKQFAFDQWGIEKNNYLLCTIHRAENTDEKEKLEEIFAALSDIARQVQVVLPLHPRTQKMINYFDLQYYLKNIKILKPVSYLEMIALEASASLIMTDSGGIQKEAFFHKVPCITLREETEWVETVELGWNCLCKPNRVEIIQKWANLDDNVGMKNKNQTELLPYGDGKAAHEIVKIIGQHIV